MEPKHKPMTVVSAKKCYQCLRCVLGPIADCQSVPMKLGYLFDAREYNEYLGVGIRLGYAGSLLAYIIPMLWVAKVKVQVQG